MAAVGQQLDNLGEIVGETRQGRSDEDYEVAIRGRVKLNISSGTIEDVYAIAGLIAPTLTTSLQEFYPAAFEAEVIEAITDESDIERLAEFIRLARPAAVRGSLKYHLSPAFSYDGAAGTGYDEGKYASSKGV